MQELRQSIKRMLDKLFPWQRGLLSADSDDCVTTSQLIEAIDTLVCEDVTGDHQTQVDLCNFLYIFFSVYLSSLTLFTFYQCIEFCRFAGDCSLVEICPDESVLTTTNLQFGIANINIHTITPCTAF